MPNEQQWPASLKADLALFSKFQADATTLAQPMTTVDDLALLLMAKGGIRLQPHAAQASVASLAQQLQSVLKTEFHMLDIAKNWPAQPQPEAPAYDILAAISGLHLAIEAAMPAWLEMPQPLQRQGVARSCRRVLALLYQMAVDPCVAQFWNEPRHKHPVPAESTAAAVQVLATLQGKPMTFGDTGSSNEPRLEGVVEMPVTRPGVGADRRKAVQQKVWDEARLHSPRLGAYPESASPLEAPEAARLSTALSANAARGRHVLLAEKVDAQTLVPDASVALAAQMGLPYVAYNRQPLSAYRHAEADLNYRALECLDEIAKLNA